MVWIHGGGFQSGSGSTEMYGPDYFVEQDVVLVAINYRCGALGNYSNIDVGNVPSMLLEVWHSTSRVCTVKTPRLGTISLRLSRRVSIVPYNYYFTSGVKFEAFDESLSLKT